MKKTPKDLDESISYLTDVFPEKDINSFKKAKDLCVYHHTLGRWIRNEWELWNKDSVLLKWFIEKGLSHPDDISSVILDATQASMNEQEFDLDMEIGIYKQYWANVDQGGANSFHIKISKKSP